MSDEIKIARNAFRFTITRQYHGVIIAANEDEAQAALERGDVEEIDCAGGEMDATVREATSEDVEAAELNECLFGVQAVVEYHDDDTITATAQRE